MSKKFFVFLLGLSFSLNSLAHYESDHHYGHDHHGHDHHHPYPVQPEPEVDCDDSDALSVFCSLTAITYGLWTVATLVDHAQHSDILAGGEQGALAILQATDSSQIMNIIRRDPSLQKALGQVMNENGNMSVQDAAGLILSPQR